LYDEPTAGLDPIASTVIEDLMRGLKDKVQCCSTYVVVTHQETTIRRTVDRVVFLYKGRIQWQGSIWEMDHGDNPYMQQFLSGRVNGPIQVLG
jgi:phospholipid/cholesterol/gamma-HCH transport system ATP-binding protein